MKYLKWMLVSIVIVGFLGTIGWIRLHGKLRYRLTVIAELDGRTYSGAGVVEISYSYSPFPQGLIQGGDHASVMNGHAITIDLGEGGKFFVIDHFPSLIDPSTKRSVRTAFNLRELPIYTFRFETPDLRQHVAQLASSHKSVDLPVDKLPMVVRFRDINDPNSLEEVDPRNFAPRGKIVRATIQITDAPITPIPDAWPAWLRAEREQPLHLQNPEIAWDNPVFIEAFTGGEKDRNVFCKPSGCTATTIR